MDPRNFKSVSDVFRDLSSGYRDRPGVTPAVAGAHLALARGLQADGIYINLCAAFVAWWRAKNRIIWRVKTQTADYLKGVGLYFIPERAPSSWSGDSIVIESTDKRIPIIDDVFSITAYLTRAATTGEDRYYFVSLTTAGAAWVTSIKTDIGRTDGEPELADMPFVWIGKPGSDPDMKRRTVQYARFVFAFSYYALSPERVEIQEHGGPVVRGDNKKPVKRMGKPVYLWQYRDLSVIRQADGQDTRGPLDKEGLELSPVIVSPYIRRHKDKVIIVDQHESHRWKRPEGLGVKRRV